MSRNEITRRDFSTALAAGGCLLMGCPGCLGSGSGLRYDSQGELHRDFHASILDGVNYLLDNYGEAAVREVLASTAQCVYRTMRGKLMRGDSSELLEWWRYYMDREGGRYVLEEGADGSATLTVQECPALTHLKRRDVPGGRRTCWATGVLTEALVSGTPFDFVLEETGDGGCRQRLRRRTEGGAA